MLPLSFASTLFFGIPVSDETIRASVLRGLDRLESAATNYTTNRSCVSCHHQALPVMALSSAKNRGYKIGDNVIAEQVKFTIDTFKPRTKAIRGGSGIGGANTTAAYALLTLKHAGHTQDETTDALVEFLLKNQKSDGSWQPTTDRPPSEGSFFTSTALALETLRHYGVEGDEKLPTPLLKANENGLAYLQKTKVKSTEDRVFRIWGLIAAKAPEREIRDAVDDLLNRQRADGGWSQLDDMASDAYATGSVMTVLRKAGIAPRNKGLRNGVRFLIFRQDASGAWIVTTRSKPIQKLFDNGDPGGKSQFISIAATGWAVMALMEQIERK
jgi:N-acyl-D-amino-acid deacylase